MAAAGIGNVLGYVDTQDGANPRIIHGTAMDTISGGVYCYGSGVNAVVGSQRASYTAGDIKFAGDASGTQFNGVAIQSAGSNTTVSVATRGVIIAVAAGAVIGGEAVKAVGTNSAAPLGSTSITGAKGPSHVVGRAITGAASGGHFLLDING